MRTQRARRAALFLYCCAIFALSSRHGYPEIERHFPLWMPDPGILAHFMIYFGLGLVAWNTFKHEKAAWLSRRAAMAAFIFTALYGVTDEIHQLFVPGRNMQARDFIMNTLAAAAAAYCATRRAAATEKNK
ncbi:MAG TPA: VanZ family protein [bacterium]|nr:VanZ family protein [bacterium]